LKFDNKKTLSACALDDIFQTNSASTKIIGMPSKYSGASKENIE
jgi:hypothetical protein